MDSMTQSSPGLQTIRKVVVVTNINLQYTDFSHAIQVFNDEGNQLLIF